jgi:hypothetical protein
MERDVFMGVADSKYIDEAGGVARVGGNEALYRRLLSKFAANVDMDGFDAAVSAEGWEDAGKIVHAAKGVAGNLSLTAFFDESVILMEQLRGGGPADASDIESFRRLYGETLAAIDAYLAD